MILPTPSHCRPRAYRLFAKHVVNMHEPGSLLRAAVAVSMHELDAVDVDAIESELSGYAERIAARVSSGHPRAFLAHAHEELFQQARFGGNDVRPNDAFNSYLPLVLETRKGLPIILTLIYKCVLEQLGIAVKGINSPGHFLAQIEVEGDVMIIDPFHRGQVLSPREAFQRVEVMTGLHLPRTDAMLRPATPYQWLARILRNLQNTFLHQGRSEDLAAVKELHALLNRCARTRFGE